MSFKWTSSKTSCNHPALEKGDCTFYESFNYKKENFKTGEFVIVKEPEKKMCKVGRLLCVYQSHETWNRKSPFRGIVNWYIFAKDLDFKLKSKHKLDWGNEIVQDNSSVHIYINLENIMQKCKVVCATIKDPVYLISSYNLDKKHYFSCRYKIETNQLVPMFVNENLSNFDELDAQKTDLTQLALPEFVGVNHITPIKSCPIKYEDYKRKHARRNSDESNSDTELEKIKSLSNPLKTIKLTPKSDKKLTASKRSIQKRSSSVRRVLNDSFGSLASPITPPPSYEIVDSKCDSKNHIKMKFKLNDNQVKKSVEDITPSFENCFVNLEFVNVDMCGNNDKIEYPEKTAIDERQSNSCVQSIRRSNRNVNRKSYAEFVSPQFETPTKRSRRNVIDSDFSDESTTPAKSHTNGLSRRVTRSSSIYEDVSEIKSISNNTTINKGNEKLQNSRLSRRSTRSHSIYEVETPKRNENDNPSKIISTRRQSRRSKSVYDETSDSDLTRPKRNIRQPSKYNKDDKTETNSSPIRHGVKKSCDNATSTRPKRNVSQPRKYSQCSVTSTPVSKETVSKTSTPTIIKPNLRKSILKNSTKKLIYVSSSSEDEDGKLKSPNNAIATPTRSKCTPTAKAKMVRDGVITPSVQNRENVVQKDGTPLARARSQLHVSYVPKSLPCREKEFRDITNFLEGKLLDGCGGCMYISGVPGTGKTATVTEVIHNLQQSANSNEIPDFKYVNINGMRLSEPRQSYVEIVKQLMGKNVSWEQAQSILENKFVKLKKKTSPIILVVDELDILCTKRQDVVYNLLDWPTKANTQLIVVTIANTMDLPERLLMGRVTSRLGLTRLTFQAYTHKQLQEIVTRRLTGTNAFNPDAIQLVARKVASVSGDARRALDICRRSAEIAELEGDDTLVSLTHVNKALSAMITQPKVQAIKRSSKLEKLVLQAVVAEVERTGVEETTFNNVFTMLVSLAALEGFKMVSNTIVMGIIAKLGACRLLLTDQKCNTIYQRIILNVSSDDVYYALTKTDF